jgi:deferrochelatase/peroxidase EfeB
LAQVRRANSGMSARQEQDLLSFFKDVKNLRVSLRVTNKSVTGDTAEADVEGSYQFVLDRQGQTRPVRLHVSLARAGPSWRITAITQ